MLQRLEPKTDVLTGHIQKTHFSRQTFIKSLELREFAVKIASKFYDSIFSYDFTSISESLPTHIERAARAVRAEVASNKNYYVTTLRADGGCGEDGWFVGYTAIAGRLAGC